MIYCSPPPPTPAATHARGPRAGTCAPSHARAQARGAEVRGKAARRCTALERRDPLTALGHRGLGHSGTWNPLSLAPQWRPGDLRHGRPQNGMTGKLRPGVRWIQLWNLRTGHCLLLPDDSLQTAVVSPCIHIHGPAYHACHVSRTCIAPLHFLP